MTFKKRGLGRGLEALLVDVSNKEDKHQLQSLPIDNLHRGSHLPPEDMDSDELKEMDEREAIAIALIDTIQKETLNLLQEAEGLKVLLDEFEAMVRQL
jgi:hypothetical protein